MEWWAKCKGNSIGRWTYLAHTWIEARETASLWNILLGFILAAEHSSSELDTESVSVVHPLTPREDETYRVVDDKINLIPGKQIRSASQDEFALSLTFSVLGQVRSQSPA